VGFAEAVSTAIFDPQGNGPYLLLVNGAQGNFFQRADQLSNAPSFSPMPSGPAANWTGLHTFSRQQYFRGVAETTSSTRGEIQAFNAANQLVRQTTFTGNATIDSFQHPGRARSCRTRTLSSHWVARRACAATGTSVCG